MTTKLESGIGSVRSWKNACAASAIALFAIACSSSSSTTGGGTDGGGGIDASSGGIDASVSNDSGGGTSDSGAETAAQVTFTMKLGVPASYTGQARQLIVALFDSLPPQGPPSAVLDQMQAPAVTAGQSLTVTGDASGVTGDYFVLVVLFMNGGGQMSPKAGVDYVAASPAKVHFDGMSKDLGTLNLALYGAADAGADAGH